MSNINFEEITKDCVKYKTKKLLKVLPEFNENPSLRNLVEYETRNFKNFQMYNVKNRVKRDEFFESIINNVKCKKTISSLKKILSVCKTSEQLIDDVKIGLKSLPIMDKDIQTLCWAIIQNALNEGYHLQDLIESHIESIVEKKEKQTLNSINIRDKNGNSISPDSSLDKIVNFLTLTLKMFSHEHKLSQMGEIIIPDKKTIDEDLVNDSSAVFYYSLIWNELITCTKSCILFDNDIEIQNTDNIPNALKEDGINTAILFNRTIDEFERYDSISNERLTRRLSQNLWESLSKLNIKKQSIREITDWSGKIEDHPILLEEYPSLVSLMEAISNNDASNIILGLSLREWVRGYSVITYISQKAKYKVIYTKSELLTILKLGGFTEEKADLFIKNITFGNDSRDLYDSPLIKTLNSSFFLFTPAYSAPQISNIILSKFSSKQVDLSKKGHGFEDDMINILNKYKLVNRNFKFKRGEEQFEYDAIFILNNKAFILECKNTTLSGGSITRAYQKKKLILSATEQVKRLVKGLTLYPEVFKEHFNDDVDKYELIPVIMNNLPLSLPGKINGVYVTDSSSFNRLIKSRYIKSGIISHKDGFKITDHQPIISMWENDILTSTDIINHFNNPIQLQDFLTYQKIKRYPLRINKEKIIFNMTYETDYDAINTEQSKIFGDELIENE